MNRLSVHVYAAARRRRRSTGRSRAVVVTRVRADVWSVALDLADHDTARLRVESPTAVLVINRGRS